MNRPENLPVKRWELYPPVPQETGLEMGQQHPVLLQVLYNRKITNPREIDAFLKGRYLAKTDPLLLKDMDVAVRRIKRAIDDDEIIVVYGDFDADGVTATVLLVEALRGLGLERRQVLPYIPDRVKEGYGLSIAALEQLRSRGAGVVISVDCGIRSFREVERAQEIGLDMIITDHHTLGARLPPALAVINPKRTDSDYPERQLAGVGIAYKLAQALWNELPERVKFEKEQLLDLVALGTVADLTPLKGENRALVAAGLKVLNEFQRPGIEALARVASLTEGAMTTESISFGLAPRINAAGRLSHAYNAARLLSANNNLMAEKHARLLNDLNKERQRLTKQLGERAEEMVEAGGALLFAADSQFISGIVGLIASRLSEKHYRPAIVVEQGETESRGSCRSIPEFHITEALDELEELLVRHGGHAMAAGFTVDNANLREFESRITGIAEDQLASQDLAPTLKIDAEVQIGDVDWALHGELDKLEPTGAENRRPILMSRGVHVYSHRAVGVDGAHLQLFVGDSRMKLSCIAFRQGAWAGRIPDHIDLVYTLNANDWKNQRRLQLVVQDIHPAENSGS